MIKKCIAVLFFCVALVPFTVNAQVPNTKKQTTKVKKESDSGPKPTPYFEVNFSCNVDSAIIYVDEKSKGFVNESYKLKEGKHMVKLMADGYEDYDDQITVGPKSKSFNFTMTAKANPNTLHADYDNPEDLYIIGKCFYELHKSNDKIAADTLSFSWLKEAAEKDYAPAQKMLSEKYLEGGYGIRKDTAEALNWLIRAAENGDVESAKTLAEYYFVGNEFGNGIDTIKALYWYEKVFECPIIGYISGYRAKQIGLIYSCGYSGIEKKYAKAEKWYEKAFDSYGHDSYYSRRYCSEMAERIGNLYKKGDPGLPKDYSKAKEWYEKAFDGYEKGYSKGNMAKSVGELYKEGGPGLPKDNYKAKEWYEKAFDGYKSSYSKGDMAKSVGDFYKDEYSGAKAVEWYEKAFESYEDNYSREKVAEYVGDIYKNGGSGFSKDYAKAKDWYVKAALESDEYSCSQITHKISELYEKGGPGLNKDEKQAKIWYSKTYESLHSGEKKVKKESNDKNNQVISKDEESKEKRDILSEQCSVCEKKSNDDKRFECYLNVFNAIDLKTLNGEARYKVAELANKLGNLKEKSCDYKEAKKWYEIALKLGPTWYSQYPSRAIAGLYMDKNSGKYGLTYDYSIAKQWCLVGVDSIFNEGLSSYVEKIFDDLVNLYRYGGPGLERNIDIANKWDSLKETKTTKLLRGLCLELCEEYQRAIEWYKKEYKERSSSRIIAIYKIADLYQKGGHGLQANHLEVINWYKKAVENGDPTAMIKIAKLYESGGYNLEKDPKEAARWYRMAAEFDFPEAKEALKW